MSEEGRQQKAVQPLQVFRGYGGLTQSGTARRSNPELICASLSGLGGYGWIGCGRAAEKSCTGLLTLCHTSNIVWLTNPSRLSLDRRTRTGAPFSGVRA